MDGYNLDEQHVSIVSLNYWKTFEAPLLIFTTHTCSYITSTTSLTADETTPSQEKNALPTVTAFPAAHYHRSKCQ